MYIYLNLFIVKIHACLAIREAAFQSIIHDRAYTNALSLAHQNYQIRQAGSEILSIYSDVLHLCWMQKQKTDKFLAIRNANMQRQLSQSFVAYIVVYILGAHSHRLMQFLSVFTLKICESECKHCK